MAQAIEELEPDESGPGEAFSRKELEQLQGTYAENGYLIFRDVVSRPALARLCSRILDEFEKTSRAGVLFSGGGLLAGHLNCSPGEEARFAYEELKQRGIIEVIRALSPKVMRAPNVGCNLNLPGSVTQHYHVDRPFTMDFMIVNVAVVDTDVANGAIELAPGTHKKFYKYWRFALERPYRSSRRIPLQQGDVLVRSSNLWHRGMPNHTAVARPMLAFTWEDGGTVLDDPFQAEGGRVVFRPNWYRPTPLGQLRERTFLAAPISYSAYRFVRSLFGSKGYDH